MEKSEPFDLSTLSAKLDLNDYFRDLATWASSRKPHWQEWVDEGHTLIYEVWQEGDELWSCYYLHDEGPSGSAGLVVLREGEAIRVWYQYPCIM